MSLELVTNDYAPEHDLRRSRLVADDRYVDRSIGAAIEHLAPSPKVTAAEWPLYLQRIGAGKVTLADAERASLRSDAVYAYHHAYLCKIVWRIRNKYRARFIGWPELAIDDATAYLQGCLQCMPRWSLKLPKTVEKALNALEAKHAAAQ